MEKYHCTFSPLFLNLILLLFLNSHRVLADYCGANSHYVHPVLFTPGANSHLDERKNIKKKKKNAEQEKGEKVQKWCEKWKKKEKEA